MRQRSHNELRALIALSAAARAAFPRGGIESVTNVTGEDRGARVSGARLEVLVAVAAYEGESVAELGLRLGIHATGVGRALTALEAGGLVLTSRHDRREPVLTKAGRDAVEAILVHATKAQTEPR